MYNTEEVEELESLSGGKMRVGKEKKDIGNKFSPAKEERRMGTERWL